MQHYPVYLNTQNRTFVVSGAGECALAKLRLLIKTEADIRVIGADPIPEVRELAKTGRIKLVERIFADGDAAGAALFYAANDDEDEDQRVAAIARREAQLVNIVDNLQDSEFITPAIVDRDPVTVAIGTEGAAPVLARKIKASLEEQLPSSLGVLARIAKGFRQQVERLTPGRPRRKFWARFYSGVGARALEQYGEHGVHTALQELLDDTLRNTAERGHVSFVGAGPGDPDLLTMKARKALHEADVVLYDRLIAPEILELARREATLVETGKTGFGKAMAQAEINDLILLHAGQGHHVVRLKSGDATVFGRLDEEIEALDGSDITWDVVPGITSASAAAATLGVSLTRRGRNSELRLVTGHDVDGFAEQEWSALARPGATAAFYMAKRAAHFIQGRLLMHGASSSTPITLAFNVSRADRLIVPCTLGDLRETLAAQSHSGPALIMLGLHPHAAQQAIQNQLHARTSIGVA